jgi:hypothetical protein
VIISSATEWLLNENFSQVVSGVILICLATYELLCKFSISVVPAADVFYRVLHESGFVYMFLMHLLTNFQIQSFNFLLHSRNGNEIHVCLATPGNKRQYSIVCSVCYQSFTTADT